jgi:hypothetical protein
MENSEKYGLDAAAHEMVERAGGSSHMSAEHNAHMNLFWEEKLRRPQQRKNCPYEPTRRLQSRILQQQM